MCVVYVYVVCDMCVECVCSVCICGRYVYSMCGGSVQMWCVYVSYVKCPTEPYPQPSFLLFVLR